jgi:hypothetical protein
MDDNNKARLRALQEKLETVEREASELLIEEVERLTGEKIVAEFSGDDPDHPGDSDYADSPEGYDDPEAVLLDRRRDEARGLLYQLHGNGRGTKRDGYRFANAHREALLLQEIEQAVMDMRRAGMKFDSLNHREVETTPALREEARRQARNSLELSYEKRRNFLREYEREQQEREEQREYKRKYAGDAN